MTLLKKLKLIKILLFLVLFFNILSVSTGIVLGVNHWLNKESVTKEIQQINNLQKNILLAQNSILKLTEFKSKTSLNYYDSLISLKNNLKIINPDKAYQIENIDLIKTARSLNLKNLSLLEQESNLYKSLLSEKNEILIISILTIIFGVVLPFFIMSLLYKTLRKTQQAIEDKVRSLFEKLAKQLSRQLSDKDSDDENRLSQKKMYLNILLVSVEELSPLINHPIANYAGKISRIINSQIKKESCD